MTHALSKTALAARYALFAAVATAVNLGTQAMVLAAALPLAAAMAAGTATGLVAKYLLDKRWIFFDREPGHARKFSLYTLMGLITTALFWGVETAVHLATRDPGLTMLGGLAGLVMGYWLKYRLDRRWVFRECRP